MNFSNETSSLEQREYLIQNIEVVDIETSTACNRKCSYCPNVNHNNASIENSSFMDEKIFSKIPNRNFLPLRSYFNVSLAAYLFTLPLILYYFGNLSISAPLVNLLVLPFLPFLMFFIFLFAFVSLVFPFFSFVFSWPVWLLLTYVFIVARFFASLPYLSFSFGSFPFFLVVLLYFLIVCLVFRLKKQKNQFVLKVFKPF